jgi:hypothetical protein
MNELQGEDSPPDVELEIDVEDTSGGGEDIKPWDPAKIRITTKNFSLRDVVDQIEDGDIDLAPDFQREYVWQVRQRTRLIESILLGIPLPAFYFNQDDDGTYQVVDGVQRLSTISLFMRNEHALSAVDLEYLTTLDGLTYEQLDAGSLRRFRATQIVVHVIEPQTPDEVKFDIFNRVNTLGSPLSAQEIRHAMSKARSRKFIGELAEAEEFDKATDNQYWRRIDGVRVRHSARMTNRELALRFCAFRKSSIEDYRVYSSLDAFLIDFTKRIDDMSTRPGLTDDELAELAAAFKRGMTNAHQILGAAAFRRWPPSQIRRGPINRAVFEAQANALADYPLNELLPRKDRITELFRAAFDDPAYLRAVTVGTGDFAKVALRLEETRRLVEVALQ